SPTGEMAIVRGRHGLDAWYSSQPGVLARASVAGGTPRDVLEGVICADWSHDGSQLGIVRIVQGKIPVEFPAGTLVYETTNSVSRLRVSPDGKRLAFNEKENGFGKNSLIRIWDGSGTPRSFDTQAGADRVEFAWTPDGREVWFSEVIAPTSNDLRA